LELPSEQWQDPGEEVMRALRVGLTVVLVVAASGRSRADDASLATAFSATAQELRDDGQHPTYYVPFEPAAGVDPAVISWRVVRVSTGLLYDGSLIAAFTPSLDRTTSRPRLAVTVDFTRFTRPGTYSVEIELIGRPAGATTAPPHQVITLQLTHPGATLRPNPSWIVWRTVPLFGAAQLEPARLPLSETSRRARLAPLTINQYDGAKHDDEAVSGSLSLAGVIEIPLGETRWAAIEVRDDFPLGTTKGQLEIRAPQLVDPVMVPYEVRTRRPGWYVIPIFALFGLLGWLFRVHLKRREELLVVRVQAGNVLVRLEDEKASHPVPSDRIALGIVQKTLDAALEQDDAAAITASTTAAASTLAAAATSRAAFRSQFVTDVRAQAEVLSRRWVLPPRLDRALVPIRTSLLAAEQQAIADRLDDARAARAAADDAVTGLLTEANRWARRIGALLAARELTNDEWKAAVDAIRGALAPIPSPDPGATIKVDAVLSALHAAHAAALGGLFQIASWLRGIAHQVGAALGPSEAAQRHAAAIARAAALDDGALVADPEQGLSQIIAAKQALADAIRSALTEMFIPAGLPEVDHLLSSGAYLEAVKLARPTPDGRFDIAEVQTEPVTDRTPAPYQRGTAEVPSAALSSMVLMISPAPARAILAHRARDLKQLLLARVARGTVSLAVSTFGAYLLYGAAFVGTAREIGILAAVAFSIEFTVEHALDVIGRAVPKAP
jgi:hypothetical protein